MTQHLIKLGTALGTAAVSLSLLASSAFASSTVVFNTGDNFHLNTSTHMSTSVRVTNNNFAWISQSSWNNVNTGHNTMSRNIFGGDITTGNASVNNMFFASANNNFTSISF